MEQLNELEIINDADLLSLDEFLILLDDSVIDEINSVDLSELYA